MYSNVAIKDYDEMKRKLEGIAVKGRRTDLKPASDIDIGWTTDKTAKDLGISSGSVRQAIQIAKNTRDIQRIQQIH